MVDASLRTKQTNIQNKQQCIILTSLDPDEPVQPPFKLRNSNDVLQVAEHS